LKVLLSFLMFALVISMAVPVYAQTTTIDEMLFQGTNSNSEGMSSLSALEWKLIYQDGTESGTTQFASSFFEPFPLSFVGQSEQLRTLLSAEVRGITSFSGIGDSFCHDLPRWSFDVEVKVNGISKNIPKHLFGQNEFNENTAFNRGFGVKFFPPFIESQLALVGVDLKTGDVVTWAVSADNRFTLYRGEAEDGVCEVVRGTAWDAYTVGMGFGQGFIFTDPFSQIIIPSTTEPDLDGDGIPDRIDQCDFSGERFNGFQDEDGCPDADPIGFDPSLITDQDGDGILDVDDFCPNDAEIFNGKSDGDGCPDGAILDVNFISFEATGQEVVDLSQEPIPEPLPPIFTGMEIETEPVDVSPEQIIEDDPETNFLVPEQTSDDPILVTGTSDVCDRATEDCNIIIQTAVQIGSGIMVPFELSLVNIIFLFGAIVVAILIIMFLRRKRR